MQRQRRALLVEEAPVITAATVTAHGGGRDEDGRWPEIAGITVVSRWLKALVAGAGRGGRWRKKRAEEGGGAEGRAWSVETASRWRLQWLEGRTSSDEEAHTVVDVQAGGACEHGARVQ